MSIHISKHDAVTIHLYNDTASFVIAPRFLSFSLFFFNDTATTEIYTLSLHDALPISLALALSDAPDLVLLDVMMPRMSGWDVCRELRRRGIDVPVIMLTARGGEVDREIGRAHV